MATSTGRRKNGINGREGLAGWLFTLPALLIVGVFLAIPVLMALWVSLSDWKGFGPPIGGRAQFVGLENYGDVLYTDLGSNPALAQKDFGTSIRNNFYYVLLVVPLQTALALFLAVQVNRRMLRGKGFFRTAFYFPSVTSSIAISVVFLFLFANSGAVNAVLSAVGIKGPAWFSDSRGLFHIVLGWFGAGDNPGWGQGLVLGRSVWDWFAGPSVAMCVVIILAVWTTTGTFMLMFLAALQDVPVEVEEAAMLDGATGWQKLRHVTIPMLKPAFFLVTTLGLIGTWQLFDQIYVMGKGAPANTTLTPAYLSYKQSFTSLQYGSGAAMSFIVFVLIVVLTAFQRWLMRDKDVKPRRRFGRAAAVGVATRGTGTGGVR